MDDYIKREEAIKICNMPNYNIHDILFALKTIPGKMIPAADVRENVRGEWVFEERANQHRCPVCGCDDYGECQQDGTVWFNNYCPNCGADMRGEKDCT